MEVELEEASKHLGQAAETGDAGEADDSGPDGRQRRLRGNTN